MLKIRELLFLRGLKASDRVKILRHADNRYENFAEILEQQDLFEKYQSYQSKPIFEKCDYIVAFIGLDNSQARFRGVFKVGRRKRARDQPLPADFKYPEFASNDGYCYELSEVDGFEDLRGAVIHWGKAALSWHQWLTEENDKGVIEILPEGYVREFPGYLNFVLTYDELCKIICNFAAHRVWHQMLSAVAGIYLIVDRNTGKQYVGSAYGEKGFLARWTDYANCGHGGNKQLAELLQKDVSYVRNFQFSILETLPGTHPKEEVIAREAFHKRKLGSRAFGLNSN